MNKFDHKILKREADSRLSYAKKAIELDGSNSSQLIQIELPVNPGSPSGWNTVEGKEYYWDHTMADSDLVIDMLNTYILITMRFIKYASNGVESNYRTANRMNCDSIPFDCALRMIKTCAWSTSNSSDTIEDYTSGNESSNTILQYLSLILDRNAAENMDVFFTPIFEDSYDNTYRLRPNSYNRAVKYCSNMNTEYTKAIPMWMLFASCDKAALLTNVRKFNLRITLEKNKAWKFGTVASLLNGGKYDGYSGVLVTDMKLMINSSHMDIEQNSLNIVGASQHANENLGFLYRKKDEKVADSKQIPFGEVPNMNIFQFGIRAVDSFPVTEGNPAQTVMLNNPSQWLGCSIIFDINGLDFYFSNEVASFSLLYGNMRVPEQPISMSKNCYATTAYQLYKQACMKAGSKTDSPMIKFNEFVRPYCIYTIPFFNTRGYKENDPLNQRLALDLNLTTLSACYYNTISGNTLTICRYSFVDVIIHSNGTIQHILKAY